MSKFDVLYYIIRYYHGVVMGDFNYALLGPVTHDKSYLTNTFHRRTMTILQCSI